VTISLNVSPGNGRETNSVRRGSFDVDLGGAVRESDFDNDNDNETGRSFQSARRSYDACRWHETDAAG
jgi:hypothetical protein